MKIKGWVFILTLVALLVAACGGAKEDATGNGGSVSKDGHITLDFWYALGGDSGTAIEELIKEFNSSQPEITVAGVYQGDYTTAMAKVYSAIAGQTLPNIAQLGGAPLLGSSGVIIPMSDFFASDKSFDPALIRSAFWDYNNAGGVLWTMPFNNSVPILYYNRDLFTAAGLDPDKPPQNVDELLAAAQTLTIRSSSDAVPTQWGLNTRADTHWYLSTLFLENGAKITNQDETEVMYNSPEAVAMLQIWGDWVNKYKVMPANQHEEALSDFLAGKIAMMLGSTSHITTIQSSATFKVGTALFPAVGNVRMLPLGGGSLVIFKNSDQRLVDASWKFVKFMASKESSIYLTSKTGYIPIYGDAQNWSEIQSLFTESPLRRAAIDSLQYAVSIPVFSALGNSDLALRKAVEQVELGVATPQQALDEAKTSVDHAIKTQFQVTP